jgi:hypothetical protein
MVRRARLVEEFLHPLERSRQVIECVWPLSDGRHACRNTSTYVPIYCLIDSTLYNYHKMNRTIVLGNPYYRVNNLLIYLRQTFNDCFQLTFGKMSTR